MELTGYNFIGQDRSGEGQITFEGFNPATGEALPTRYYEATLSEIDRAVEKAAAAFQVYRNTSGVEKAAFLDAIADEIMALGDALVSRCCRESGLPEGRIQGERGRTVNQLKLFAGLLRDGSWVDARIDPADPAREPAPKPDIRSMLRALGPVGVFGASNFPLAFSVAGGDTASALAAGCTLVVKAHPAHPGTCEMIATAITKAAEKTNMPDGVFSMVQGPSTAVGLAIVEHPDIKAIGFTGSYGGGKALFDAAAKRAEPIPVYAEMGSTNPVFILPNALRENAADIAAGLVGSVTLGVGQFCTNPGVVIANGSDEASDFYRTLAEKVHGVGAGAMLTSGIARAYQSGIEKRSQEEGVEVLAVGAGSEAATGGVAHFFKTSARHFITNKELEEELFGPSTILVSADTETELLEIAKGLHGHLTATLFATEEDLKNSAALVAVLEQKAGRLIINNFPTGVEVGHAMVHGGPFPATTNSRTTSVGTAAILRFARPVCYQNFPDHLLPDELKQANPLGIVRLVDGKFML